MTLAWEPGKLTPAEEAVMEKLGDWMAAWRALPKAHPGEWEEAVPHIHYLQTAVMVRPLLRSEPSHWTSTDEFREAYGLPPRPSR